MNEHEATLYLAKYLNENGYIKVVFNRVVQEKIKDDAIGFEIVNEKSKDGASRIDTNIYQRKYDVTDSDNIEELEDDMASKTKQANYIFMEYPPITHERSGYNVLFTGLPLAIITPTELSTIKELSKGELGMLEQIALETLNVKQYAEYDFVELAKENPSKFCTYFHDVSDKKKQSIIHDIWHLIEDETLNYEIKNFFIKENYKGMILNEGRNKVVENG